MPQRNLHLLMIVAVASYLCYVRSEQNPYARYAASGLAAVERTALENVPHRELFNGAMRGIVDVLHQRGDLHSEFIAENEANPFREELRQQFGGIGVRIRLAGEPPQLTVVGMPEPGSPASRANILPGDRILAIEDEPIDGMTMADVLRRIRGQPGEPLYLTIQHAGAADPVTVELVREVISIESVLGDLRTTTGWRYRTADDPRIALVRITTFGNRTAIELSNVLTQLTEEGAEAVMLDLRDNVGGALDTAVAACDLFLPAGHVVVETRGRDHEVIEQFVTTGRGKFTDLPIAVLVNANSASASEIVAACLQDYGRAVVVGQRTYGKGTVQQLIPIESGRSLLKITTATYWRPSGQNIHRMSEDVDDTAWGVTPDTDLDVELSESEYIAYRKYRNSRDLADALGTDTPDPNADNSASSVAATAVPATDADFVDRTQRQAIEYLQSILDDSL